MADRSKILIVEDDADTSDMLREYFNSRGYEVLTAAWGGDALELCRRIPLDVIILDIRLPDINGYDICQELRSNLQTRRTPVIFLTHKNGREDVITGLKLGAVDYITKPFDIEELGLRVRNALQQTSYQTLVSPITDLPAGGLLEEQLKPLLERERWAVLYIGINDLTLFSETYGFITVDDALRAVALVLDTVVKELGTIGDFAGHLGEGNFIVITAPNRVQKIKEEIVARLGRGSDDSYRFGEQRVNFVKPDDAQGVDWRTPLMSISVGVITNEKAVLTEEARQISEVAANTKRTAFS
ncbi:MAG: response regulator [Anaerolineae bacterium]